ncbi:MAG: DHH family phosphoesterase [Holophaga sp.]|nr:DHH family phosphoesterase [Holophaga sp.]
MRRPVPAGAAPWTGLERQWGLSPAAARLAWMRTADQGEDLAWRLDPSWARSTDPFLLEGMTAAVARIRLALAERQPICVYGDYDVDGVTATALLVRVLGKLGAQVGFFIPNRFNDGYGLHLDCIREVAETRHPVLMISVDCGVRSGAEVKASRELGLEWIITDHHALGPELPEAAAVVHPALGGYGNPHLAGVGVAFKLAQALLDAAPCTREADAAFLDGLLKLVALGTVADMVPLLGENALLVKRGLTALSGANGPGVAELLKAAKVEGAVRSQHIGFGVGPRINAVGRMGGAEDAVRLLLTRDPREAQALMARVEALNLERREIQKALSLALPPPGEAPFDLVLEPGAHKGVIGIVAGQRMRLSGRPSAVGTVEDGIAHCSVRAPEGYDLRPALELLRPYLLSGGGHRYAAGLTFPIGRLGFIRKTLERVAQEQAGAAPAAAFLVDGTGTGLAPSLADLERMEPFGQAFPEPALVVQGSLAGPARSFGQGHRKFRLQGEPVEFTLFASADAEPALDGPLCLAVSPMDSLRWGRSWRVDGFLAPAEAP